MKSLWIETTKDEISLEPLRKDEETEVCVIGAGLFGLTTAYYLTELGKKVIVLEKGEIGEKTSGNTTGKISSLHGLFYDHLIYNNYVNEGYASYSSGISAIFGSQKREPLPSYPAVGAKNIVSIMICGDGQTPVMMFHSLNFSVKIPGWESKPFPVAPYHQTVAYIMKIN